MNQATIDRFWKKIEKTDSCWNWTASKRNKGYGAFVYTSDNGARIQGRAHRFSWELHIGPIGKNMCVLHQCDNPQCVRPSHLFLGTKADNNRDMIAKGRSRSGSTKTPVGQCKYKRGDSHWNHRHDTGTLRLLISDRNNGYSFSQLSKKYNISIAHAWRVVNGKQRKGI